MPRSSVLAYHYFDSMEALYANLLRISFKLTNRGALELSALEMPSRQKIETAVADLLKRSRPGRNFLFHALLVVQTSISTTIQGLIKELLLYRSQISCMVKEKIFAAGQEEGCEKIPTARNGDDQGHPRR
ncbi:hypothetical protein [Malonomonas rubra]|uniref:hypothetical protein n=1 Tax=Malonomonas rubra TaxID=57040 RepID=UPI0026EA055B|nr:hypothetical protein [Malonomonas rubra]